MTAEALIHQTRVLHNKLSWYEVTYPTEVEFNLIVDKLPLEPTSPYVRICLRPLKTWSYSPTNKTVQESREIAFDVRELNSTMVAKVTRTIAQLERIKNTLTDLGIEVITDKHGLTTQLA